ASSARGARAPRRGPTMLVLVGDLSDAILKTLSQHAAELKVLRISDRLDHGADAIVVGPLSEGDARQLLVDRAGAVRGPFSTEEQPWVTQLLARCGGHPQRIELVALQMATTSLARLAEQEPRAVETIRGPPRGNLARRLDAFFGRQEELDALEHAVATSPVVTVTGFGGAGKTRLVQQFGASQREVYAGGVWFCDASEVRSASALCAAVADVFRLTLQDADPVDQIAAHLRQRPPTLLLIDNLEQVVNAAAPLIVRWAQQAPESRLLLTSRRRLDVEGEQRIVLGSLTTAAATKMLIARAGRDQVVFPEPLAVQVVELLERLPLAIELAAARSRLLGPGRLLDRLEATRARPLRDPRRTARHQTLQATLTWSLSLLSEDELAALKQCAVFSGGFSLDAAEAVLDLGEGAPWVEELLDALLGHSLLRRSGERLSMFKVIQEELLEQMTPSAVEDLRRRHATTFATWCSATCSMERILRDRDNLQSALRFAIDSGEGALAVPLACAVADAVSHSGPLIEARRTASEVLAMPKLRPQDRARALIANGDVALAAHQLDLAETHFRKAQEAAAQAAAEDEARLEGLALLGLGQVTQLRIRLDEAEGLLKQALSRMREPADRALVLKHLGLNSTGQDRYGEGFEFLSQARDHWRMMGDRVREGSLVVALATNRFSLGQLHESRVLCEEALELLQRAGSLENEIGTKHMLGMLTRDLGQRQAGLEILRDALDGARLLGKRRWEALLMGELGVTCRSLGDFDASRGWLEAAIASHEAQGQRRGAAITRSNLAALLRYIGEHERAARENTAAIETLRALDSSRYLANALHVRALIGWDQSQLDLAQRDIEETIVIYRRLEIRADLCAAMTDLGGIQFEQGQLDAAEETLHEAWRVAQQAGRSSKNAQSLLALICAHRGDITRARAMIDPVLDRLRADGSIWLVMVCCRRGHIERLDGQVDDARAFLEEARAMAERFDVVPNSEMGRAIRRLEQALMNP
ncbi:MAG: hypothetical protein AAFV53_32375, partial [Myxococcota bacterium]